MVTPAPPDPFEPLEFILEAGTSLYRIAKNDKYAESFNPGNGGPTRFAFFGAPIVPVLYAAESEVAALCETLLHDIPIESGGSLLPSDYAGRVAIRLVTQRRLRLAAFMGKGLWALQVEAGDLTGSDPTTYGDTVKWAQAAHTAGFDGVVWMSRRLNSDRAYMLFGDRVSPADLEKAVDYRRIFTAGPDLDWLVDVCGPLHVEVIVKRV